MLWQFEHCHCKSIKAVLRCMNDVAYGGFMMTTCYSVED